MRTLGVNTGTSVDAIDFCLVDWNVDDFRDFKIIKQKSYPFESNMKVEIEKLINLQRGTFEEISNLNFRFSKLIAYLVNRFNEEFNGKGIELLGIHGQTIFHGEESTWQIGDGSIIAKLTGVPTISDFRPADMAVGGKGAPLISYLDNLLLRQNGQNIAALNIGGIANLTVMESNKETIAYDVGPGNTLIDCLMKKLYSRDLDEDGRIAFQGKIDEFFVRNLIEQTEFFQKAPPKSTGRELFSEKYANKFLDLGKKQNIIATVSYFTAYAISMEIAKYSIHKLYVSGGGKNNPYIMENLKLLNPHVEFHSHNELEIDDQYKEAMLFSLLAYTSYKGIPNNVTSSTGANKGTVLGKFSYA